MQLKFAGIKYLSVLTVKLSWDRENYNSCMVVQVLRSIKGAVFRNNQADLSRELLSELE